jgi:molybdopterin-dependent oxidoreductase alpha subunit
MAGKRLKAGGGWPAVRYVFGKGRAAGGLWRLYRALRAPNACKTCALGMGGQRGGMINERGERFQVCKKSIQAMAADMQGRIAEHFFDDFGIEQLRAFTARELEAAGRLAQPLYRGPLDTHYRPIEWDDALDRISARLAATSPDESFFYFSGRSSNEAGFLLQLLARLHGTNNVNNCSYYCHQASGVGLASVTGSGTATVALEDVEHCDLLILIGANPSSNHPRLMKTIIDLRRRGGTVIVINPLREVGLERFRVPSDVRSLLLGSRIADLYVQPHIGGDIALLAGVAKVLRERGASDEAFMAEHTEGWEAFCAHVAGLAWDDIVDRSGVARATIERIADLCAASKHTIFAWAMGITHHEHGVENVQMIANLALLRGMVGRPRCGLLPLRGHSNVQGIGSVGVTPTLKQAIFDGIEREFELQLPTTPGLDTLGCMEAARAGNMKFAWCLGGNLYGSNPDATFAAEALNCIDMVVYLSTTLNTGHAWGTGRDTIILPVLARDEEDQATTQESMFNYVRMSDGGKRRHEGPRSEVEITAAVAERLFDEGGPIDWSGLREHRRIRDAIGRVVPGYGAIGAMDETGEEFQIEGRTFHAPRFATPSGKAVFHTFPLPDVKGTGPRELRLMTVRSEGQFNTVVYEDEDIYRGQERRDVILMSPHDMERLELEEDQAVTVRTPVGALDGVLVRPFDVPPGNAAMYYPEANVLIPRAADARAKTPAFKNIVVTIEA